MVELSEGRKRQRKTSYLYVGSATIWAKIKRLWRTNQLGIERSLVMCILMVETISDVEHLQEVTIAYHQGKTNHLGKAKTLRELKRKYFWWGMRNKIKEVVGQCEICQSTKYNQHPP